MTNIKRNIRLIVSFDIWPWCDKFFGFSATNGLKTTGAFPMRGVREAHRTKNRQCGKIYHNFCHINHERKIAMKDLTNTEAPRQRIRFVDSAYHGLFTDIRKKCYHKNFGDSLSI